MARRPCRPRILRAPSRGGALLLRSSTNAPFQVLAADLSSCFRRRCFPCLTILVFHKGRCCAPRHYRTVSCEQAHAGNELWQMQNIKRDLAKKLRTSPEASALASRAVSDLGPVRRPPQPRCILARLLESWAFPSGPRILTAAGFSYMPLSYHVALYSLQFFKTSAEGRLCTRYTVPE